MSPLIPSAIVPSARPVARSPGATARRFRGLVDAGDLVLRPVGTARSDPCRLLRGYTPKHEVGLFDTTFWLTDSLQNYYIRFFVAYVVQASAPRVAHPRLFYKDASLLWRSASHVAWMHGEYWIGKGDTITERRDGEVFVWSRETTSDLPLELQAALESLNRRRRRVPTDERAVDLVLRRGADGRVEPFRDFTEPRRRAQADPRNRINGNRPVAWFARANDPTSLRFARGFEPDFDGGVIEEHAFSSRLYGGTVRCFRLASRNRRIQYQFYAGPRHAWVIPPQATTTELSSYGVRTVDVFADDDLFVPGFEYHWVEDDGTVFSQIPPGFAGPMHETDEARADASPWLERLPVIREFRAKLLARRRPARR